MSTSAGDIFIRIGAEQTAFNTAMKETATAAGTGGEQAAKAYQSRFQAWVDRSKSQIARSSMAALSPFALAETLANTLTAMTEQGIVAGLSTLADSVPLVGAAHRLGLAFGKPLADAMFPDVAEMEAKILADTAALERKLKTSVAKLNEENAGLSSMAAQQEDAAGLGFDVQSFQAKASGNEREQAFIQAARREHELQVQLDQKLAESRSEAETDLLKQVFFQKLSLIEDEMLYTYDEIAKKEQEVSTKKTKDDAEAQAKREQEARDFMDDELNFENDKANAQAEAHKEWLADSAAAEKSLAILQDEAVTSAQSGLSSASTALGTFTFDAYPSSDKRANDNRIIKQLEIIAGKGTSGGGFL